MKSDVETLTRPGSRLTVEVPFEELKPSLDAAYKTIAASGHHPRLPQGQGPDSLIDQRFGRGAVLDEAVNEHLPAAYGAAVREHEVRPLGQPEVDVTEFADGGDLKFTAEVDVRPRSSCPTTTASDRGRGRRGHRGATIDEQVDALRARFATLTPVERAGARPVTSSRSTCGDPRRRGARGRHAERPVLRGRQRQPARRARRGGRRVSSAGGAATFARHCVLVRHDGEDADITVTVKAVRERELPRPTTTSPSSPSEFDTLEELRSDLRAAARPDQAARAGRRGRDKVARRAAGPRATSRCRTAWSTPRSSPTSRTVTATRPTATEFVAETRKQLTAQFVLDDIAEQGGARSRAGRAHRVPGPPGSALRHGARRVRPGARRGGQVGMVVGEVVRAKALGLVLETAPRSSTPRDARSTSTPSTSPPVPARPTTPSTSSPQPTSSPSAGEVALSSM